MFGIGLPEMILILALALIVVGPDKLPDLARSLAKGIMELKKTAEGFKEQLKEDGNPLDEIRPDLEDAAKSFKSHMLEHPDKGKAELFPRNGVNPAADNAAQAYSELTKMGVDPSATSMERSTMVELVEDDLSEAVPLKESSIQTAEKPEATTTNTDNSADR